MFIFSLQTSIQEEVEDIDQKIRLVEEFDEEVYGHVEVLDNLEQTLDGQSYPWDLSESGETCTLMVSQKTLTLVTIFL